MRSGWVTMYMDSPMNRRRTRSPWAAHDSIASTGSREKARPLPGAGSPSEDGGSPVLLRSRPSPDTVLLAFRRIRGGFVGITAPDSVRASVGAPDGYGSGLESAADGADAPRPGSGTGSSATVPSAATAAKVAKATGHE